MVLLTKKEFTNCLNFIYEQEEKQEQFVQALENLCPGNYCDCWLFNDYAEKYIELIKKLMDDKEGDIEYFLYEMERGKNECYCQNAPYQNEEELYDYLVQENNRKENK